LLEIKARLGTPFILKARRGGFDGRGNRTITNADDFAQAIHELGNDLYAEKIVPFERELAVVAARTVAGAIAIFPLVETIHRDHICHMTIAPARVSPALHSRAHELAHRVLSSFSGAGVFGIEMFAVGDEVLVNEVAPRVHNSGHWTIEGANVSQFEQHIRAITGTSILTPSMQSPAAVMINILGERNARAVPTGISEAVLIAGVHVHIYGKMETRMKRKMGHITALGKDQEEAIAKAENARSIISI
jgi:5-(carboxyamino)imidazole ribonucleotide synthase